MSSQDLQTSVSAEAGSGVDATPPPLVALFLIKFDLKVGNTIAWKRAANDVPLEGIVEYKSLPSGLHNVSEDLVYFFHSHYAGVSAFAKGTASEAERNAKFVAVGAMLPLKDGRLGRAWLHAASLTRLAKQLIENESDVTPLEKYWEEFKMGEQESVEQMSLFSMAQRKSRALSSVTLGADERQTLPAYHPALSLRSYVDVFGPLIFPLHRAALLRKRILIITSAPVRDACEFVYDLSVATSTPLSLASSLVLPSESLVRLRPLFAVGVHDIPFLESLAENGSALEETQGLEDSDLQQPHGWIACTTDEILAMKTKLYDVVVELPSDGRKRPTIKLSDGKTRVRASQRDLRRWHMLKNILNSIQHANEIKVNSSGNLNEENEPLLRSTSSLQMPNDRDEEEEDTDAVESTSWSELAYSSFLWWASAGEKNERLLDEENQDKGMLSDLLSLADQLHQEQAYRDEEEEETASQDEASSSSDLTLATSQDARIDMALISYFHKLTRKLFEVCTDLLEEGNEDEDDENDSMDGSGSLPKIDKEEMRAMGLDGWSTADHSFIKQFFELWYERDIDIRRLNVECCGLKIC